MTESERKSGWDYLQKELNRLLAPEVLDYYGFTPKQLDYLCFVRYQYLERELEKPIRTSKAIPKCLANPFMV